MWKMSALRACFQSLLASGCMVVLCWCVPPAEGASANNKVAAAITRITLERQCFGCEESYTLELQRGGTAIYTSTGHARQGTQDRVRRGRLASKDFDALARLIAAQHFLELEDSYEDPDIRDGPWSSITVLRGNLQKQVFRRDEAGPDALKAVETAIAAQRSRIRFEGAR